MEGERCPRCFEDCFMNVPDLKIKRVLCQLKEEERDGELGERLEFIEEEAPALLRFLHLYLLLYRSRDDGDAENVFIKLFIHVYFAMRAHVTGILTYSMMRQE